MGVDTGCFCLISWLWVGYESLAVRPRARLTHCLLTRGYMSTRYTKWGTFAAPALALSMVKVKEDGNRESLCPREVHQAEPGELPGQMGHIHLGIQVRAKGSWLSLMPIPKVLGPWHQVSRHSRPDNLRGSHSSTSSEGETETQRSSQCGSHWEVRAVMGG